MPTSLSTLGIRDKELLRKIADSCGISKGSYKPMTKDEIYRYLWNAMKRRKVFNVITGKGTDTMKIMNKEEFEKQNVFGTGTGLCSIRVYSVSVV